MRSEPIRDLVSFRNWTLTMWKWRARRCWTYERLRGWLPGVKRYWSGKIVHYTFGPFELVHDTRGGARYREGGKP